MAEGASNGGAAVVTLKARWQNAAQINDRQVVPLLERVVQEAEPTPRARDWSALSTTLIRERGSKQSPTSSPTLQRYKENINE